MKGNFTKDSFSFGLIESLNFEVEVYLGVIVVTGERNPHIAIAERKRRRCFEVGENKGITPFSRSERGRRHQGCPRIGR